MFLNTFLFCLKGYSETLKKKLQHDEMYKKNFNKTIIFSFFLFENLNKVGFFHVFYTKFGKMYNKQKTQNMCMFILWVLNLIKYFLLKLKHSCTVISVD